MKQNSKTQLNQILADKAMVMPIDFASAYERFATVDYIEGGEKSLPKIHFKWVSSTHVRIQTEEELAAVVAKFPDIRLSGGNLPRLMTVVPVDETGAPEYQHIYVCNFRRYGWCWSTDPDRGYTGTIYANGNDGGLTCSTPEQVVRETMLLVMASIRVPDTIKWSADVRPLWERLLEDALEHVSKYASHPVGQSHGFWTDLTVNGEAVGPTADRLRKKKEVV